MKKIYKKYLILSSVLIFIGAGCSDSRGQSSSTSDVEVKNTVIKMDAVVQAAPPEVPAAAPLKERAKAPAIKTFKITGKNWEWSQTMITVKKGDHVRLVITGADADHGFAMKDFGINVTVKPGETKTVDFVADKVGEFGFRCSIPCGEGHRDMVGKLVVE